MTLADVGEDDVDNVDSEIKESFLDLWLSI